MRARTEFQKKVIWYHYQLPKLNQREKDWAINKAFKFVQVKKKTCVCAECTHEWAYNPNEFYKNRVSCPKCGKRLEPFRGKERTNWHKFNVGFMQVKEGLQVIRYYEIYKVSKAGNRPDITVSEQCQFWIDPSGKFEIVSRNHGMYGRGFSHDPRMELRHDNDRYYLPGDFYPRRKILPIIKRNGFRKIRRFSVPYSMHLVLDNQKAETLIKAGQDAMFTCVYDHMARIDQYWTSIKICIRNKYIIEEPKDWFDHLRFLEEFGLDIYSPKYICPENFAKEHQLLIGKRQKAMDKENAERKRIRMLKDNAKYIEKKEKFFPVKIEGDGIVVEPLKSLYEFRDEGKELHHCVFGSTYYDNDNKLILSAKKDGKRLETIDFDLRFMKVDQSRGLQNKPTKYHKKITSLVNSNSKLIKEVI